MNQNDRIFDVEHRRMGKNLSALSNTIACRNSFRTGLRKHLIAQAQILDAEKESRTLDIATQDKGKALSPSWFQHLAPGVGRINRIFKGVLTMKKGFALASIVTMVVVISTVAFVPPVRAWAQSVLAQFGALIITDAPTWSERVIDIPPAATPIGQPTATPFTGPLPIMTIEEASAAAGFQVLSPGYIPAGYRMVARDIFTAPAGVFAHTTCATDGGEQTVSIGQDRYVPGIEGEFSVGDALTVDVTVRGLPGLWAEGAKLGVRSDGSGGRELYGVNVLIWEEGDNLFFLTSNELALEEMLKIAESLK